MTEVKKSDYLALNLPDADNTVDYDLFFTQNYKTIDTKIKSIDTDISTVKTTYAKIAQESTFNVALTNGAAADGDRGIRVFKDTLGLVHVYVNVNFGAVNKTVNTDIGVLPVGYRPIEKITQAATGWDWQILNNNGFELSITTDGRVVVGGISGGGVCSVHVLVPGYKPS
jgi:hypothetical protein